MGTYGIDILIGKWVRGEISAEQVVGQILLMLQSLLKRVEDLETQVSRLTK
jgi:hypothetical protein